MGSEQRQEEIEEQEVQNESIEEVSEEPINGQIEETPFVEEDGNIEE